jgi:hypothetical protein
MPATALATCEIFGTIYDAFGQPAAGAKVGVMAVYKDGVLILQATREVESDAAGFFTMTLPRSSMAVFYANTPGLNISCLGTAVAVPDADSTDLAGLLDFVPYVVEVLPPLVLHNNTLSIPKASPTQDGYVSAADYLAFLAGAEMGVVSFNQRTGEVVLLDTDVVAALGYAPLGATIPGVAGQWSNPSSITVNSKGQIIAITAGGPPDTTPPVITVNPVTAITDHSAQINWTTNEPADSSVDYGTTAAYGSSTTPDTDPVTDHHVALAGLLPSQTYHYRVNSTDTAGNPQSSADQTFMTAAVSDSTPPVITVTPPTLVTSSSAQINWTTNEPADSLVDYGTTAGYGLSTTPAPALVTDHHVALAGLLPSQTYHYRVTSKDAAGNPQSSPDATFMTGAASGLDLMTGLVSYWKLEEATGTRVDSHGPNDFVPIVGLDGVPPSNAAGRIGQALSLPQIVAYGEGGSYLEAPDDPTQRLTGDFTITSWFYVRALEFYSSLPSMLSMWVADNLGFCVLFNGLTPWSWQFSVSGDGATQADCFVSGPAATKDVKGPDPLSGWHFVCAQYEAATGTMSLRIDNDAPVTQFAGFTGQIFQSTAPLHIGAFDVYRRTFADVDECALYNRLLTTAEVDLLASGTVSYPFS